MAFRRTQKRGFTLIELVVTVVAAIVVILGAVSIIANAHKGYWRLYRRATSDVVRNGYEARLAYDSIVRKASTLYDHISPAEAYVYYYEARTADGEVDIDALRALMQPNRFARFYLLSTGNDVQLRVDQGSVPSTADLTLAVPPAGLAIDRTRILAHDVASCVFEERGAGIRMVLALDDETDPEPGAMAVETLKMTVTTTAVRHCN
ncbi:MAG: prepilin-type N-terminal cleavage/methylation domain-containing protein [Planctomycetota bacterium]|jgi:hypothetical protein